MGGRAFYLFFSAAGARSELIVFLFFFSDGSFALKRAIYVSPLSSLSRGRAEVAHLF